MRPCPTRIRARAVMVRTGSGSVDYIADRVQVIDVSLSSSGDEVDRSEVLDPLAPPRASVVLGRRMASVTIQQEVYGDLSQHAALFRACPVEVTQSSDGVAGSVSSSPSARGERCTIEIVEVGGNRYRIEDALGVFTMSGAPGERLLLQFDLQGELVPVEDAGLAPMAFVMPPAPLVYRNASLMASEQAFATCPEFSFDPGITLETMDLVCSPTGGRAAYVQRDAQAVLALTGVLSVRESVDGHWAAARAPVCGSTLDAAVWSDGASSVRVELRECATADPELSEVEGFAAYDLAVGAGSWSLVWDIDEGVPLPVQLGAVIWLDPSDVATLFVDSAGTTPVVASGDPVGLWKNKGTLGAVGDFKIGVSAQRPTLDSGAVLFDGLGSRLSSSFTPTLPASVFMNADRYGPPPTGGAQRIISTPTANPYVQITDTANGVNAFFSEMGLSGSAPNIHGRQQKTIGGEFAQGVLRSWIGSVSASATSSTPSSNYTLAGPWSLNLNGGVQYRCGHVLIFDRILTDQERAQLIAWMEAQHD